MTAQKTSNRTCRRTFLVACLAMLFATSGVQAQDDISLSGVALKITDSSGGTAVAVLDTEIPVDEESLVLPAYFEGDIETTTLTVFFETDGLVVLSGITNALPPGSGMYLDDLNFILLDVSEHSGESGELRIEMTTESEADLFIVQSAIELYPGRILKDGFESAD